MVAFVTLAILVWWQASPYWAIHQTRQAVISRDAKALNERIDYPRVREDLKRQLMGHLHKQMRSATGESSPMAAFGKAVGAMIVDNLLESLVSPESILKLMQEGRTVDAKAPTESHDPVDKEKVSWSTKRHGLNKVVVTVFREGQVNRAMGVVFERSGFATWRVVGIELPDLNPDGALAGDKPLA